MIVLFGVLIAGLGIYARIEVSSAVRDMERRFELLAGQALKRPQLQILYDRADLDRRVVTIKVEGNGVFRLSELHLKNIGDRPTETLSVRLYLAHPLQTQSGTWQPIKSPDSDFPAAFYWVGGGPILHVSPQEAWETEAFFGKISGEVPNEILGKVQAFYGWDRPAEAMFTIRTVK